LWQFPKAFLGRLCGDLVQAVMTVDTEAGYVKAEKLLLQLQLLLSVLKVLSLLEVNKNVTA